MKNILFYGDSNTWGFDPETRERFPLEKRWTTICAQALGAEYCCIPSGMNGRTTGFDDPVKACRNGMDGLDYALQSHKPLDLFVLMLGTNDLKYADAEKSAEGMEGLIKKIISANERFSLSSPVFPEGARVLLIAPVLLRQNITETGSHDARIEAKKLPTLYNKIAVKYDLDFMDAALVTDPSQTDGTHLSQEGHLALGMAAAEKIRQLLH